MNKVLVYSTTNCPYCVSAKNLFQSLQVPFDEIDLTLKPELRMQLSEENNGWRTVPMIFIGGKFCGGFSDVAALHKRGELLPLIQTNV
jgi:glutaredoxin 3